MHLQQLEITQLRNIEHAALELSPRFNLFHGANGSGKTSVLEAIYLLGLARSFRHRSAQSVIQYNKEQLTVFGLVSKGKQTVPIGIQRTKGGKFQGRIKGETIASTAELAQLLPLQLVNPDSYQLLTDGPKQRRQFIDWGLFHVEHRFLTLWKRWQRLLAQRNAALKQQLSREEIISWDEEWITLSEELTAERENYIEQLTPIFLDLLQQFNQDLEIAINYKTGWKKETDLATALKSSFSQDLQFGYTQVGPQRADLVLTCEKHPVQDVLSRGQQKLLVYALRLAQGILLEKSSDNNCIYLLDDLTAELDEQHCCKLIQVLLKLPSQAMITGVECDKLTEWLPENETKMFHVKHGTIG